MFDLVDFLACLECLLLGTEEAKTLWESSPDQPTQSIRFRTWRTQVYAPDFGTPCAKSDQEGNAERTTHVIEFIDLVFRHARGTEEAPISLQMGALFSSRKEQGGDQTSVYTLSDPLSAQDIASHYSAIGAELDDYNADETLNLAKMLVTAAMDFQRTPVEAPDKVVLFYKEFDSSLSFSLQRPRYQELSNEMAMAAFLGVVVGSGDRDSHGVKDEDVQAIRTLVQRAASPPKRNDPVPTVSSMSHPIAPQPPKAVKPVKAKPAARKIKQKVVLQNRKKAHKLLPK